MRVLVKLQFHCGIFLSPNNFFANRESEPVGAAPIFAFAAILDPGIDAIHKRVGNSPSQVASASNRDARQSRKSCAQRIALFLIRAPPQDRLVPNRREAIDLHMWVIAKEWL